MTSSGGVSTIHPLIRVASSDRCVFFLNVPRSPTSGPCEAPNGGATLLFVASAFVWKLTLDSRGSNVRRVPAQDMCLEQGFTALALETILPNRVVSADAVDGLRPEHSDSRQLPS